MEFSRDEIMALLKEWEDCCHEITKMEQAAGGVFIVPDSRIFDVIWELEEKYTKYLESYMGSSSSWLEWYRFDNEMGLKKLKAGYNKKPRQIKNLNDLAGLIMEERDRK